MKNQLLSAKLITEKGHANGQGIGIFSDHKDIVGNITRQTYRSLLGTEQNQLVYCDSQFDIDALAALSGTLVAGGVMLVVLSEAQCSSRFVDRFLNLLAAEDTNFLIEQGKPLPSLDELDNKKLKQGDDNSSEQLKPSHPLCYSNEQENAVKLVLNVVTGHRDRPLVLTADRGRGKSTTLAIACIDILAQAKQFQHIVVTSGNISALSVFFRFIKQHLADAEITNNKVEHKNGIIEFLPIDQLLEHPQAIALLLVDEAAGIPVYLLEKLLLKYHRTVFASTVHGYEGAGRGFTLKFAKILASLRPQWRKTSLTSPIRWAANDPLEGFIFKSCLLNAELGALNNSEVVTESLTSLSFRIVGADELATKPALLSEIFATLVTAHYQTSPSDLKQLLDNDKVSIAVLTSNEKVVAVAMLMAEGLCCGEDVLAVKNSQRRLKNQFLPQSLFSHCGIENAFDFHYLRVMRIAVHPQLQAQGIGSHFIRHIVDYAKIHHVDFVGSSFGVNKSLLNFWLQNHFSLARIGFTKDKASGEHSALVLNACSAKAQAIFTEITTLFYRQFDYLLTDEYQQLDAELVWQILHAMPKSDQRILTNFDINTVQDFSECTRLYSACVYSLHLWLVNHCQDEFSVDVLPLITRILQKESIKHTCQLYGFTGKKALNQHLVSYIGNDIDKSLNR
ncbi:GNAT family N-acetyltransferase [Thalassotalea sp. PLHSN55]|uniref:GNAT family N-acetyltransferase n=1 Tax=Thalassotalea sp. PLHSN55 TaxID=3435888 RepID=UPI003F848CA6